MDKRTLKMARDVMHHYRDAPADSVTTDRRRVLWRLALSAQVFAVAFVLAQTAPPVRPLSFPIGPLLAATGLVRMCLGLMAARLCVGLTLSTTVVFVWPHLFDIGVMFWVSFCVVGLLTYAFPWHSDV